MRQQDFDKMFKEKNDEEFNHHIHRRIQKNIYKKVSLVMIAISLVVVTLYKGTSYLFDYIYYNPFKEDTLVEYDKSYERKDSTFHIVFQTYCEIFYPGIDYFDSGEIESLGFGRYRAKIKIHDLFHPLYADGSYNMILQINQSHMSFESTENHLFSRVSNEFYNSQVNDYAKDLFEFGSSTLKEIEDLPDSSQLNVSISFDKVYQMNEMLAFMQEYKDMTVLWMAIDSYLIDSSLADGISLWKSSMYDLTSEAKKKYPYFYIGNQQQMTPEVIKQYYLSNLKLLLDHPKEVNMIAEMLNTKENTSSIEKIYNYVQNDFQVIGLRINIRKNELLKMVSEKNIHYMYIHDVKLSYLQK